MLQFARNCEGGTNQESDRDQQLVISLLGDFRDFRENGSWEERSCWLQVIQHDVRFRVASQRFHEKVRRHNSGEMWLGGGKAARRREEDEEEVTSLVINSIRNIWQHPIMELQWGSLTWSTVAQIEGHPSSR